jgi:hypothetical protein
VTEVCRFFQFQHHCDAAAPMQQAKRKVSRLRFLEDGVPSVAETCGAVLWRAEQAIVSFLLWT